MDKLPAAKVLCSIFIALIFSSCSRSLSEQEGTYLARVGEQYLSVSEAQKQLPDHLIQQDSMYAIQQFREDWIKKQLLLKEANRLNLAEKQHVKEKIAKARNQVLIEALKDYVIGSSQDNIEVTDEEARSFYQANKQQFALDEEFVRFRHLRTRNSSDARSAKQDLLGGVSWDTVAKNYAIDPQSALQGSDQYWPISMAVQNINIMNRYLNVIGQDEISPIQRVDGDYHFVQLLDRRAKGEQPDLSWLIEEIKDWMVLNKNQRNFSSYLKNLYLDAKSNNDLETFDVTTTHSNPQNILSDTLEHISTDE